MRALQWADGEVTSGVVELALRLDAVDPNGTNNPKITEKRTKLL